jgi:hypothetical protein
VYYQDVDEGPYHDWLPFDRRPRTDPTRTQISGLQPLYEPGLAYVLTMTTYSKEGNRKTTGGDFYEAMVYSETYRQRILIEDQRDGTYKLHLNVRDRRQYGGFHLCIYLMFDNDHALVSSCDKEIVR